MSLRRLWAIMHKEFRHILRDRRILLMVTLSPDIMLITFAYVFSFDITPSKIAIYDQDHSAYSRNLMAALSHDHQLIPMGEVARYHDLEKMMQARAIKLGIIIPAGFGKDLAAGQRTDIQIIGDGSDPINTGAQLAILSHRIEAWAQPYQRIELRKPAELRSLTLYNRDSKSRWSMVPALLAIAMILPSMAIAVAMARERELGSFESLAATPVEASEYVLGKLLPYILFGVLSAAIAVGIGVLWFQVPLRGSRLNLLGFTLLYLWATLSISGMIASFIANQSTALRAVLLLFLVPSFFLTGLIIPIDENAKMISYALPATHFIAINRGLFLKGLGWGPLGFHSFMLLTMGLFSTLFTILSFRKRVG